MNLAIECRNGHLGTRVNSRVVWRGMAGSLRPIGLHDDSPRSVSGQLYLPACGARDVTNSNIRENTTPDRRGQVSTVDCITACCACMSMHVKHTHE